MSAPIDRAVAQELNANALRRLDPEIEEVLATSGHVCLYHMSVDSQQWARKNVEGSLFLLKRRSQPRFQMMVLNKLNTENYSEAIHGGLDFEVNAPYLMYTHGNAEIHGIWFYERDDLERFGALLQRIKHQLPRPESAVPQQPQPAQSEPSAKDDNAFWDKQVTVAADAQVLAKPDMAQRPPAPAVPQPDQPANHLARLLRQATEKKYTEQPQQAQPQQPPQQQQAPAQEGPPLLSPSFFQSPAAAPAPPPAAQPQQQQQPAPAPAPQNAGQKLLEGLRRGPQVSPHQSMEVPRAAVQEMLAGNHMENPIAKLFAKAGGQPAGGQPPVQPPPQPQRAGQPPPQPQRAAQPPPPAAPAAPAAAPAPPAKAQQVTREKVRTVLRRLADNDAFVDMLAQELAAVGLIQGQH